MTFEKLAARYRADKFRRQFVPYTERFGMAADLALFSAGVDDLTARHAEHVARLKAADATLAHLDNLLAQEGQP